jgi:hypothetical protein
VYRLTEAGWNVIRGRHARLIATFRVSVIAAAIALAILLLQLWAL